MKSAKSVENRSWNSNFTKIFFLKTHKTASSTIENIMMRLCWNYNKTLARKDWKLFSCVFCILRFLTFSFTKILVTNRVKCDKSGKWGISCGLNFLQYRLKFLKVVDFQNEQKTDKNRKTLCKMYEISRKRVNLSIKEKVWIIRNDKFLTWKKCCMKKMLHGKMLNEENPQTRLGLDFVGKIRCTGTHPFKQKTLFCGKWLIEQEIRLHQVKDRTRYVGHPFFSKPPEPFFPLKNRFEMFRTFKLGPDKLGDSNSQRHKKKFAKSASCWTKI